MRAPRCRSALGPGAGCGTGTHEIRKGTLAIYSGRVYTDFVLEVDVAAADNDGQGLVWAYVDTGRHYRAMMIDDVCPVVPVDGDGVAGPSMQIQRRISNVKPGHELLAASTDDYVSYNQAGRLHWTLEVGNGAFAFTREDGFTMSAADSAYMSGYVGIQLYAHQAEFDNIAITALSPQAVGARGGAAVTWAALKAAR